MLTLAARTEDPDRFYLVDVRDAKDYAAAYVTGAVHIPLAALERRLLKSLPAAHPWRSAVRAAGALQRALENAGRFT